MALTNEELNKRFSNPFKLVTYAIEMAKNGVRQGHGMRSHLATDVLANIAKKDMSEEEQQADE